jgi:hypothetical protein
VPWKDDLFHENTLWGVWKKSPSIFSSKFNTMMLFACFVAFLMAAFVNLAKWDGKAESLASSLNAWAVLGFSFSSGILGFLVTGFAIFTTISKPELFIDLAQTDYPGSTLSALKYIFFSFINIFVHYLCFLILCLAVNVSFWNEWPSPHLSKALAEQAPKLFGMVAHVLLVWLATWFVILLLKLKSFIWNVYITVLLSVAHEAQRREQAVGQSLGSGTEDP